MAEFRLSVNVPEVGFFQSLPHPATNYNVDGENYNAGGLKFECLEPMRRWKITFNGLLRRVSNTTQTRVNMYILYTVMIDTIDTNNCY